MPLSMLYSHVAVYLIQLDRWLGSHFGRCVEEGGAQMWRKLIGTETAQRSIQRLPVSRCIANDLPARTVESWPLSL